MFQKDMHTGTGEQPVQDQAKWRALDEGEPLAENDEGWVARHLEARLSAYYGPALPPYPLPEAAWLRLRDQLDGLDRSRSFLHMFNRVHTRPRQTVPIELQHSYATLLLQTNYRYPSPVLACRFSARQLQPRVKADVLGRGRVNLVLPRQSWQSLQKAELDMLLAAGLARCNSIRRSLLLLPRVLFAVSLLLVLAALPFTSIDRRAVWISLVAVACCLASGRMLIWQQRVLAFRGDRQAVQWLGRQRVCQGLHLLAEHGQPGRRPVWGEPSLNERIARVCGSPIMDKDKHLTLVG